MHSRLLNGDTNGPILQNESCLSFRRESDVYQAVLWSKSPKHDVGIHKVGKVLHSRRFQHIILPKEDLIHIR